MSLEHFGLNRKTNARVSFYKGSTGNFETWKRLPEESMAFMIAIGGGGGGAGGSTAAAGVVRSGGGGGGSGAIARLLVPLVFLPDTLYIQAGRGGAPGAAATTGGNGSAGERSYISIAQNTTAANIVLQSGNAAATGGTGASTAGSAAAGVAETISTVALSLWGNVGISTFIAGKIGAIGGVVGGGAGAANTILTASIMNGGAGGGTTPAANTNFSGGAQTGAGIFPTIAGATAGLDPINGSGGYEMIAPILGYGGVGGGTSGASGAAAVSSFLAAGLRPLRVVFLASALVAFSANIASLKSTNSIILISALSPLRLASFKILVYPPGRSPTF